MTNIILTGVTGFVGRHLFFEIIKVHIHELQKIQIFILGRNQKNQSLKERILQIFQEEGFDYLHFSEEQNLIVQEFLTKNVFCIEAHLNQENVIQEANYLKIKDLEFKHFFHIAALADLRSTPQTEKAVQEQNVIGTKNILGLAQKLQIQEFDYVGTAYVSGTTTGNILPNYINLYQNFRNPYEKSKLESEILVREFAKKTAIPCRYFRPSIICGRLLERPFGHTHKFDVFYELFGMMFYEKVRHFRDLGKAKKESLELSLRAMFNPEHSINIVAVDYAVKLMYQICFRGLEGDSFHLVNEKNTIFGEFLDGALQALKVSGISSVKEMPQSLNQMEMMYYSRAGGLFSAYMTDSPTFFDTKNIQDFTKKIGLNCPQVGKNEAYWLIFYAMKKHFGINFSALIKI